MTTCPAAFGPIIRIPSNENNLPENTEITVTWTRTPQACNPRYPVTILKQENSLGDVIIIFKIRGKTFSFTYLLNSEYLTECLDMCTSCEVKKDAINLRPIKFIIKITNGNEFPSEETYQFDFNTALDKFIATYIYPRELSVTNYDRCNGTGPSPIVSMSKTIHEEDIKVEVPDIRITAQSDLYGNNLGNVVFEVLDIMRHHTNFPCETLCKNSDDRPLFPKDNHKCHNKCPANPTVIDSDKVKHTAFSEYPHLNDVLKGEGCNLREKAEWIIGYYRLDIQTEQFMINLIEYSMGKYILSRLLFKRFSIKYLLERYNEKFFERLSQSRYCRFLEKFDDFVGYERYFKY